ncbi:MAG: GNAT family N-acetyltransferase [Chloroflexi bacterium]|nr:GNAT family N-acetyltransferase [Chloroflexota bacterium]
MRHVLNALTVTPYERRHRQAVRDLLFRAYRVHTHLDWQESDQWLDEGESYPARLVWQGSRLQGIIATSAPLNQTCWLRILAINDQADAQQIFSLLWNALVPELRAQGVHTVALLMIRNWLSTYVTPFGFRFTEEIITFRRPQLPIPADAPPSGLAIRQAQPDDLSNILDVDNRAFVAPWQMEREELRQAERISASCTVAELGGRMVGYELSTLYFDGAHLARLAVVPEAQGIGVARALLSDLLNRFARRGVYSMTVNTQSSNMRSQHLYTGFGFERTGYDLPVWMAEL